MVTWTVQVHADLASLSLTLRLGAEFPELQSAVHKLVTGMVGTGRSARLQTAEAAEQIQRLKRREPEPFADNEDTAIADPAAPAPTSISQKEIAAASAARQRLYGNNTLQA